MGSKTSKDYLAGYEGKKLLQTHSLREHGIWQVFGEDRSCGGSFDAPNTPYLGTFEGQLSHVIDYMVELAPFWTYGSGGRIEQIQVQKITAEDSLRHKTLTDKLAQLKREADELE
jgi:hypothetical protein